MDSSFAKSVCMYVVLIRLIMAVCTPINVAKEFVMRYCRYWRQSRVRILRDIADDLDHIVSAYMAFSFFSVSVTHGEVMHFTEPFRHL